MMEGPPVTPPKKGVGGHEGPIKEGEEQVTSHPPTIVIKQEIDLDKLLQPEVLNTEDTDEEYLEDNIHLTKDIEYIEYILEGEQHISSTPAFWRYISSWEGENHFHRSATLITEECHY